MAFGCCNDFIVCSDARGCVHKNDPFYEQCEYRRNLEQGKIFYGKNANNGRNLLASYSKHSLEEGLDMQHLSYEYNKFDRRDVLRHAKALESKLIGDVYRLEELGLKRQDLLEYYSLIHLVGGTDSNGEEVKADKGRIGNLVQEIYFGIPRNNISDYDIEECHVELKVSKLKKKIRNGLSVQERLILGMISRTDELPESFEDSHIYKKCRLIMLVYYINREAEGFSPYEYPFHKSAYMVIPQEDMALIKKDYAYIRKCVNEGRYDDLHEGETMYLSPAPKNGGRAYSFKVSYMNQIFKEYIDLDRIMYSPENDAETYELLHQYDAIVKPSNYDELNDVGFDTLVLRRFSPYFNFSMQRIRQMVMKPTEFDAWNRIREQRIQRGENTDKSELARTTFLMLGISSEDAEEFVRGNVYVKTLKVNKDGTMNEDISFPAFDFADLANEKWEESQCVSDMVERKFLWSVFQESDEGFIFKGAKFWHLPADDVPIIRQGWEDIQSIVNEGVRFVKDRKDDGTEVLTPRGKNRILNSFPDTRNTDPLRKEYWLCKASKPLNPIISIRPHSALTYYSLPSIDYFDTEAPKVHGSRLPNGDIMTKQSFWFNSEYILTQVQDLID